jgi:alanyl-tRNA synthetase
MENIEAGFVAKVNTDLRTSTSLKNQFCDVLSLRNILGKVCESKKKVCW